jgi:hypothetical protein
LQPPKGPKLCLLDKRFSIAFPTSKIYELKSSSTNPVVKAIITGTAPRPAQLAAARGILPLPQTICSKFLVALAAKRRRGTGGKRAGDARGAR